LTSFFPLQSAMVEFFLVPFTSQPFRFSGKPSLPPPFSIFPRQFWPLPSLVALIFAQCVSFEVQRQSQVPLIFPPPSKVRHASFSGKENVLPFFLPAARHSARFFSGQGVFFFFRDVRPLPPIFLRRDRSPSFVSDFPLRSPRAAIIFLEQTHSPLFHEARSCPFLKLPPAAVRLGLGHLALPFFRKNEPSPPKCFGGPPSSL